MLQSVARFEIWNNELWRAGAMCSWTGRAEDPGRFPLGTEAGRWRRGSPCVPGQLWWQPGRTGCLDTVSACAVPDTAARECVCFTLTKARDIVQRQAEVLRIWSSRWSPVEESQIQITSQDKNAAIHAVKFSNYSCTPAVQSKTRE